MPELSAPAALAADLPEWAAALPLWAGAHFLWIVPAASRMVRYWHGGAVGHPVRGESSDLDFLPFAAPYPLIVLDCQDAAPPAEWWQRLEAALAPGGVLFICGARRETLPAQIRATAPGLRPASWHVITPGQDADWHLRPATAALRRLVDTQLQPAYSVRAWMVQVRRRWVPSLRRTACLPVWRTDPQQAGTLQGMLSPDLLALVAGHPVREALDLLHTGQAGSAATPDKRLMFLLEAGATYPFALIKWARNAAARRLLDEHAALAQLQDLPDPLLAGSYPPSWGPFVTGAGALITIERYLPARAVYAQLRTSLWPRQVAAVHFRRAATWLARFAAATRQPPRPLDAPLVSTYIAAPLQAAQARFGLEVVPPAALAATVAAANAYLGTPVALTAEHGDLWPANLLLPDGGGLYVVDWEHYLPAALPGFDMLLFCTSYAIELPWRPFGWVYPEVGLARAYIEPTWLRKYIAGFLARCCAASRLPPGLVPVLLPVMLARMALRYAPAGADGTAANLWTDVLRAWWRRPAPTWLETWAREHAARQPSQ